MKEEERAGEIYNNIIGTVYVASQNPWKRFFLVNSTAEAARVKIISQPGMMRDD